MNRHTLLPFFVSVFALLFLFPFASPLSETQMMIIFGALFLSTSVYAYLIATDRAADERELHVRAYADRLASMSGMIALVVVIGVCIFTAHPVTPGLVLPLVVMVSAKAFGQWYGCKHL